MMAMTIAQQTTKCTPQSRRKSSYHMGLNYAKHKLHNHHHCKSKGSKGHGSTLPKKLVTTTRNKVLCSWATTKDNAKHQPYPIKHNATNVGYIVGMATFQPPSPHISPSLVSLSITRLTICFPTCKTEVIISIGFLGFLGSIPPTKPIYFPSPY